MTAAQVAAFQAGSGVVPASLLAAIAGLVLTLALVWASWLALGSFRAWQAGRIVLFELMWSLLRASIVLLVLGWHVR